MKLKNIYKFKKKRKKNWIYKNIIWISKNLNKIHMSVWKNKILKLNQILWKVLQIYNNCG